MQTANLTDADHGSFYTILGVGGDLNDWTTGITECLVERGIGTPKEFYTTTGKAINEYAATKGEVTGPFADDLTVLMFPLDGLNGPKLAVFKMHAGDRWFDDIVTNMVDDPDDDEDEDEDDDR